jgi:hypothetical protein
MMSPEPTFVDFVFQCLVMPIMAVTIIIGGMIALGYLVDPEGMDMYFKDRKEYHERKRKERKREVETPDQSLPDSIPYWAKQKPKKYAAYIDNILRKEKGNDN